MSIHARLQCTVLWNTLKQKIRKTQLYKGALITHHSNNFWLHTDTSYRSPTKQHVEGSFSAQVICWMGGTFHPINIYATSNELIKGHEGPLVCQCLLQTDRQWEWVCWYAPSISGMNPSPVPTYLSMWAQPSSMEKTSQTISMLPECGQRLDSTQRQHQQW